MRLLSSHMRQSTVNFYNSILFFQTNIGVTELPPIDPSLVNGYPYSRYRGSVAYTCSNENNCGGKFTATFCQSYLAKRDREYESNVVSSNDIHEQ